MMEHRDQATKLAVLLRTVDEMRPFVSYRLRGRPNDVDTVLQRVREVVWRRVEDFDISRGEPNAWVFGITRKLVLSELTARGRDEAELTEDLVAPEIIDPLEQLVGHFESHRWMGLVAEFVGGHDWEVITQLALFGDADAVAARHHLSPRGLRTIHDRVVLTAHTVRAALAAADAHLPASQSVLLGCVPEQGGLRETAELLGQDADAVADTLGIHPGSARSRIALAKRMLAIAAAVLAQEHLTAAGPRERKAQP